MRPSARTTKVGCSRHCSQRIESRLRLPLATSGSVTPTRTRVLRIHGVPTCTCRKDVALFRTTCGFDDGRGTALGRTRGQGGIRRRAVDGLLVFCPHARMRLESERMVMYGYGYGFKLGLHRLPRYRGTGPSPHYLWRV